MMQVKYIYIVQCFPQVKQKWGGGGGDLAGEQCEIVSGGLVYTCTCTCTCT